MLHKIELNVGGKLVTIETGHIARQASGAVLVRCGGTVVICTATGAKTKRRDIDFFPLTIDYRERTFAAGKIPGGYFKREGRPTEKEILAARLIDRPIRPLFHKDYLCPTHVVSFVLSHDQENSPDVLAMMGASFALMVSDLPFLGPIAPVRVARKDGEYILNPTLAEIEASDINLVVVCSEDAIVMVEGGANIVPEKDIVDILQYAFEHSQDINAAQHQLRELAGKPKRELEPNQVEWLSVDGVSMDPELIFPEYTQQILDALQHEDKATVYDRLDEIKQEIAGKFDLKEPERNVAFNLRFKELESGVARALILNEKRRNDGRALDQIRPITCDVDVLPRVHGSALFTRGQTQALATVTLGTSDDEQRIDDLEGEEFKKFMLHYNFPPFSVGEAGFLRGPGRREIGHGALAERALQPVLPNSDQFPYTIRIVSEILESNGSSSMASVCGGSLSLMDCGVPTKDAVAGIAMGLIQEGDTFAVLSDISGLEDHLGDMDFKVAGTENGITAIQMDIKIRGLRFDILEEALEQAHKGRLHILGIMKDAIPKPNTDLKPYAPRILKIQINPDKIGMVVGSGGKVIRGLTAETGAKIEISDDGTVVISGTENERLLDAKRRIEAIVEEAVVGKVYSGKVRRIESYGAFIEIIPGTEGLLHISQFSMGRIREIRDYIKEGDEVTAQVIDIDDFGKVKLGRKKILEEGIVEEIPENPEYVQRNQRRSSFDRPRGRGPRDDGDSRDRRRPGSDSRHDSRRPSRPKTDWKRNRN